MDFAALALNQRGAGDIALDPAIDVEVGAGADIALDRQVGAEDRKGRVAAGA